MSEAQRRARAMQHGRHEREGPVEERGGGGGDEGGSACAEVACGGAAVLHLEKVVTIGKRTVGLMLREERIGEWDEGG